LVIVPGALGDFVYCAVYEVGAIVEGDTEAARAGFDGSGSDEDVGVLYPTQVGEEGFASGAVHCEDVGEAECFLVPAG
jgi:hypothetical protein